MGQLKVKEKDMGKEGQNESVSVHFLKRPANIAFSAGILLCLLIHTV